MDFNLQSRRSIIIESLGMVEEALEVAADLGYRFELAIQLGKLEIAKDIHIALVAETESKWKQFGELAMSAGMLDMAVDYLKHANDLSARFLKLLPFGEKALTRGSYPPAVEYVNYVDRPHINLVESFKNMKSDVDEQLQNGDLDHENVEQDGNEEEFVDGFKMKV